MILSRYADMYWMLSIRNERAARAYHELCQSSHLLTLSRTALLRPGVHNYQWMNTYWKLCDNWSLDPEEFELIDPTTVKNAPGNWLIRNIGDTLYVYKEFREVTEVVSKTGEHIFRIDVLLPFGSKSIYKGRVLEHIDNVYQWGAELYLWENDVIGPVTDMTESQLMKVVEANLQL